MSGKNDNNQNNNDNNSKPEPVTRDDFIQMANGHGGPKFNPTIEDSSDK